MHDLARRLVQDRLAQGCGRYVLLTQAFVQRENGNVRRVLEDGGEELLAEISNSLGMYLPYRRSAEYAFYTAIILTLEENPIMSTTRKGTRSRFST